MLSPLVVMVENGCDRQAAPLAAMLLGLLSPSPRNPWYKPDRLGLAHGCLLPWQPPRASEIKETEESEKRASKLHLDLHSKPANKHRASGFEFHQ